MVAGHIGVQIELLGRLACGDAIGVLVGEEVDLASGGVAEGRGDRSDRRSELCSTEFP